MLAAYGPMSVALFVNDSFIQYGSGIYNDVESCGSNPTPNHAVLLGLLTFVHLKIVPPF